MSWFFEVISFFLVVITHLLCTPRFLLVILFYPPQKKISKIFCKFIQTCSSQRKMIKKPTLTTFLELVPSVLWLFTSQLLLSLLGDQLWECIYTFNTLLIMHLCYLFCFKQIDYVECYLQMWCEHCFLVLFHHLTKVQPSDICTMLRVHWLVGGYYWKMGSLMRSL